jgi:uncharacterized membrane protein
MRMMFATQRMPWTWVSDSYPGVWEATVTTSASNVGFSKTRLEAFSDGVFAIAITLLVLDIAVKPGGSPLHEFLSAWLTYVGYVVSFITIGVAWIGHSAMTQELTKVDAVFLRLNLLLLLFVAFLPFPTRLVTDGFGDRQAERVAVTVFGFTLLLIRLMSVALDHYAQTEVLYSTDAIDAELAQARSKSLSGVLLYGVAIVVGLVLPGVAVAVYFGIALFLAVPWRHVARMLRRQPTPSP